MQSRATRDAVASLSDIKSFVSREPPMTPPVEASALVSVGRRRATDMAGGSRAARPRLFFRKECRGLMEVRQPFDGERADEWRADLDTLDPARGASSARCSASTSATRWRRRAPTSKTSASSAREQASNAGASRQCVEEGERETSTPKTSRSASGGMTSASLSCTSSRGSCRWRTVGRSVVNAMRGARDAVAYAPNCYSKLLLLAPAARCCPNAAPCPTACRGAGRRGCTTRRACRLLTAAESARPATTPTR